MKKLVLLFLLCSPCVAAQYTTTVSGQVVDTSSQQWAGGTYIIQFNPNGVGGTFYLPNGSIFTPPQPIKGTLDNTGSFSGVVLTSNTNISPIGTKWTFQFIPQATATGYSEDVTITGSTQTVNATPPSIVINANAVILPMAYADSEIANPLSGTSYFNVTTQAGRVYTSTGWQNSGGGSGMVICNGTIALPTSAVASGGKYGASSSTPLQTACTGMLATDSIHVTASGDWTGITGYAPSASGGLTVYNYPDAGGGHIDTYLVNDTSASITPSAATEIYVVTRP